MADIQLRAASILYDQKTLTVANAGGADLIARLAAGSQSLAYPLFLQVKNGDTSARAATIIHKNAAGSTLATLATNATLAAGAVLEYSNEALSLEMKNGDYIELKLAAVADTKTAEFRMIAKHVGHGPSVNSQIVNA